MCSLEINYTYSLCDLRVLGHFSFMVSLLCFRDRAHGFI